MANPQKEDGFVPVANDIYDALCSFRIPGEVRQIFDVIIRKTYGFNKPVDKIANTQIIALTGLAKGNVSRGLSSLITHKLVIKGDNFSMNGKTLGINKDYDEWIPFVIKRDNKKKLSRLKPKLSKSITKVIKADNKKLSEVRDTKDNIQFKDNIQKTLANKVRVASKKKKVMEEKKQEYFLQGSQWNFLIDAFAPVNPMYRDFYKVKAERNALDEMAKAIGYDKLLFTILNLEEATSKLYAPKITKPTELKRDLGKMIIFWKQEKNRIAELKAKGSKNNKEINL